MPRVSFYNIYVDLWALKWDGNVFLQKPGLIRSHHRLVCMCGCLRYSPIHEADWLVGGGLQNLKIGHTWLHRVVPVSSPCSVLNFTVYFLSYPSLTHIHSASCRVFYNLHRIEKVLNLFWCLRWSIRARAPNQFRNKRANQSNSRMHISQIPYGT